MNIIITKKPLLPFINILFLLCIITLSFSFKALSAPNKPNKQSTLKLPKAKCVVATSGIAICSKTEDCNCAISKEGAAGAICDNPGCITALSLSGSARCQSPSCLAAIVLAKNKLNFPNSDCIGRSCRIAANCKGGPCDCGQVSINSNNPSKKCSVLLNQILDFIDPEMKISKN
ncbi:MAG: hypothetical protein OXC48_10220 [Endozoicomonadaceae bacterium]|nr:hypothetical protein [Endozoicomonadaceae bacterium]